MASNYVKYNDPQTRGGQAVWAAVDNVLASWYSLQRIKSEIDQMVGSPADYTQLEVPFSLVAGTGQAFYNNVVGLKANLDTTCAVLADLDRIA